MIRRICSKCGTPGYRHLMYRAMGYARCQGIAWNINKNLGEATAEVRKVEQKRAMQQK